MAYTVPATHLIKEGVVIQALDASSTAIAHDLGYTVRTTTGKEFVYCQVASDNVVTHAGYPAYWMSGGSQYYIHSDASDCQETDGTDGPIGSSFAGVFACAIAANNGAEGTMCYAWIQTKGEVPDASVSTDVTAQETLCAKSDNFLDVYSTATESSSHVVAYALEAVSGDTADIMLLDR